MARDRFLLAPSSGAPEAWVINRNGEIEHWWRHPHLQPAGPLPAPGYMRGWNHVELGLDGALYAIVPLGAVLKLTADSTLQWACEVSAHHDFEIQVDGSMLVLTEEPRLVEVDRRMVPILDNGITMISAEGEEKVTHSIYDLLCSNSAIAGLIESELRRRFPVGWQRRQLETCDVKGAELERLRVLLVTAEYRDSLRDALRLLRDMPSAPSDVLHTNTLEVLRKHPAGCWERGHILLSMRSLNLIAVVDLNTRAVVWSWGPGVLSRQHQPSALDNGHILVFENGYDQGRSRLLEIDPVTREIVWSYLGDPPESFFSPVSGGCQQLEGDTILVAEATSRRAFEVDRRGKILWNRIIRERYYRIAPVPNEWTP